MESSKCPSASFNTDFSIKPELSQSTLITILLIAAFTLATGLFFLWHDKNFSWVPITISLILIIIAFIGWWHSQQAIDMGNSSPTHISDSEGNQLITDTRALESSNAINNIGILFQTIGSRHPLPLPDGLVDKQGKLVPNSKSDAETKINEINKNISEQTESFIKRPFDPLDGVEQKAIELPVEAFDSVLKTNKPENNEQP